MDHSDWAAENLQVIRTLMERSTVYRRALAPIMLVAGLLGLGAAIVTCFVKLETNREFSLYWLSVGVLATLASLLLVRRQALKEAEEFWSLPTRRVGQAVLPAFLAGLLAGILYVISPVSLPESAWLLAIAWLVLYGCGMHAAGFFVKRGIKLVGWIFVLGGVAAAYLLQFRPQLQTTETAHYLMGIFFGLLHLGCAIYLYVSEKKKTQ
jgi:cytochrome c biogenesis protein CcdA